MEMTRRPKSPRGCRVTEREREGTVVSPLVGGSAARSDASSQCNRNSILLNKVTKRKRLAAESLGIRVDTSSGVHIHQCTTYLEPPYLAVLCVAHPYLRKRGNILHLQDAALCNLERATASFGAAVCHRTVLHRCVSLLRTLLVDTSSASLRALSSELTTCASSAACVT